MLCAWHSKMALFILCAGIGQNAGRDGTRVRVSESRISVGVRVIRVRLSHLGLVLTLVLRPTPHIVPTQCAADQPQS